MEADVSQRSNDNRFDIVLLSQNPQAYGARRRFELRDLVAEESRIVVQWQLIHWPVKKPSLDGAWVLGIRKEIIDLQEELIANAPQSATDQASIYGNVQAIKEHSHLSSINPVLVHCTSGVGRSGAFVAAYVTLDELAAGGVTDIFAEVKHLRTERAEMVQSVEEYDYIYEVLATSISLSGNSMLTLQHPRKQLSAIHAHGRPSDKTNSNSRGECIYENYDRNIKLPSPAADVDVDDDKPPHLQPKLLKVLRKDSNSTDDIGPHKNVASCQRTITAIKVASV